MITCVCNNVSEQVVNKLVESGKTTLEEIKKEIEIDNKCHCCNDEIIQLIEKCLK